MPSFMQSHPFHRDRYVAILKQTDMLKAKAPRTKLYIGKRNLAERISRKEKRFDE